ncbi:dihydrodipicolinate synthase family protein [Dyella nitratireducens]|uniref:Dihydrodipicolinate synthase family protein n=1 Tax=Dyella nitratireducens TaxID=1849580 RepID=A0ABQ1FYC7_9GAMM|nr:dihydrodipicolinate synthase family protein [Dyella nitratireducens]GGA33885.1 dihydrodipicolinate synthase family protein [Dyella nitratireducens]GLQ40789.1 dihydrodipicolinate synthase family protein [Dyella nitratireducens]
MSNASMWHGVLPAITTPFTADDQVDHAFLATHAKQLIDAGCRGIVPLGSLGEAATLSFEEKLDILRTLVKALEGRAPVIPGIASLSTREAVKLAKEAKALGCGGLMVLPPYVYSTDWREMGAHVRAVIAATDLPCMLYNNPVAYKTDFTPAQIAELAGEFSNLQAVKESSADVRRFAGIRALLGDRLQLLVGMDDAIVEGVAMGAVGWIAGLVNAYPKESVKLYELARDGGPKAAEALYKWFLPLLRLDTVPTFVQLIKLVQEKVGMGSERVRAPRLPVAGAEREMALKIIDHAIATKPAV